MFGVLIKVTKLIKYHGEKGRIYYVKPLNYDINNYNVYNRNKFIKIVIFYIYLTLKIK
jgi:hypothetical protein